MKVQLSSQVLSDRTFSINNIIANDERNIDIGKLNRLIPFFLINNIITNDGANIDTVV